MMSITKHTVLPLIIVIIYSIQGYSQQSVISAGGDFTGIGGSMSFSTGLTDYYYYGSPQGSLQFGVQHAFFESTPGEIPEELEVPNTTLAGGDAECFNALFTITTGGDGNTFIVESGALAELIAGQNIRMLHGTRVVAGGYLHARITTNGTFCGTDKQQTMAPLAESVEKTEDTSLTAFDEAFESLKKETLFRVYPNPTTGMFTLELTPDQAEPMQEMTVEIYGMRGERVLSEKVSSDQPHIFSLADKQPGVYIIRVLSGGVIGIERIIKR